MKPRRVVVQLELTTHIPLAELRSAGQWSQYLCLDEDEAIHQVQCNVIKPEKK